MVSNTSGTSRSLSLQFLFCYFIKYWYIKTFSIISGPLCPHNCNIHTPVSKMNMCATDTCDVKTWSDIRIQIWFTWIMETSVSKYWYLVHRNNSHCYCLAKSVFLQYMYRWLSIRISEATVRAWWVVVHCLTKVVFSLKLKQACLFGSAKKTSYENCPNSHQ